MKVDYEKIYSFAKKYQVKKYGRAWENLYDYLCDKGSKVFNDEHFGEFKSRFSKYLGSFGMFRGTKLLTEALTGAILDKGKPEYINYLKNPNKETFGLAWKKTHDVLEAKHRSTNPVVITKILMGLGGRTPAYDKRFIFTITSHPLLLSTGITNLVKGLMALDKQPLRTPCNNDIPWERVLDMAFYCVYDEYVWLVA